MTGGGVDLEVPKHDERVCSPLDSPSSAGHFADLFAWTSSKFNGAGCIPNATILTILCSRCDA